MLVLPGLLFLVLATAHALRGRQAKSVVCRVMYIEVFGSEEDDDRLECEIVKGGPVGHSFPIKLSTPFVQKNKELLMNGNWYVKIQGAQIQETTIFGYGTIGCSLNIPNETAVTVVPAPSSLIAPSSMTSRRGLAIGQRSLMVARVSVSDAQPTYSTAQLAKWYFDQNAFSVAQQYKRCSAGLQTFTPWTTSVMNISVAGSIASFSLTTLVNAAISEVQNKVGSPLPMQHVVFILPPGLSPTFTAVGQVGGWRTTFSDTFGGIPGTVMHELGHNLGLGHAGTPGDSYGDLSSIMGYGDYRQFQPSKCFNACDHYNLGWFADRTMTIDPFAQAVQKLNLASFIDYSSTSASQPVVLKVGSYCLSYNRAKGANFETEAGVDQVTVALGGTSKQSTRLADLDETTAPFTQPNYNGGSLQLVVQVCDRGTAGSVDYATVVIGLGAIDCNTPVQAGSTTLTPTTLSLTASPSVSSPPPTKRPTVKPTTRKPTRKPTRRPSRKPTSKPTSLPFVIFINAGSNSPYTGSDGVVWLADTSFVTGGSTLQRLTLSISNTADVPLYQTQRLGQMQYSIAVPKVGNYQVTLMFAEVDFDVVNAAATSSTQPRRTFDIFLQGALSMSNFDIVNAAGGGFKAVSVAPVVAVVSGTLIISLASSGGSSSSTSSSLPLVAAIKVMAV